MLSAADLGNLHTYLFTNAAGGHCKNLAPHWEKAATNLKGLVKVGGVNCDEERELAGQYGIQGRQLELKFYQKMRQ